MFNSLRESAGCPSVLYPGKSQHGSPSRSVAIIGPSTRLCEITFRILRVATGIRGGSSLFGLVDQLVGDDYTVLGTPEEENRIQAVGKVRDALTGKAGTTIEPMDVKTLAVETGLTQKMVRRALDSLGDEIKGTGAGVKNDPHTYSLLSQYSPIGNESNSGGALGDIAGYGKLR